MPVRATPRSVMQSTNAAASTRSAAMYEQQTVLKRLIHNIDLLLLLLCPAVSAVGLVYTEPPLAIWLLYSGGLGFAVALVMNHQKHQRARRQS